MRLLSKVLRKARGEIETSMTGQIGRIKGSIADARSGRLMFLSHCILNQNACVRGLASQPAVIREIVDLLLENEVAFFQMPCPEVSYIGSQRWGQTKQMYGSPMFHRHCRKIAEYVCDQAQTYLDSGHDVIGFVMRDGSPTCGLRCAAVSADEEQVWGGMVWNACPLQRFGDTPGVFTEELMAEREQRGLTRVPLFSLPEVEEAGSFQERLEEIRRAILGAAAVIPPG